LGRTGRGSILSYYEATQVRFAPHVDYSVMHTPARSPFFQIFVLVSTKRLSVKQLIIFAKGRQAGVQTCLILWLNINWINPLTPKDPYSGRTAPLTSKLYILYIYSTNIGTQYFKHGIYSPIFLFKMRFVS